METPGAATLPRPAGEATPTIDVRLIVPFINSVRSVFETMVKVPTTVCRPEVKSDPKVLYDVSSIIGFSGDVVGNVIISLQLKAATKLLSSFAGMEIDPGSPEFADGIGELANMIAGGAKKHLGSAASITLPSVIMGGGHQVARLSGVPSIVIPCQTPVGDFAVEVNIRKIPAPQ
jgi:chemotaxis protein CheX